MSTTLAPQNPLSYMGVKPPRPPNVINENRAPTTLDTNYDEGTEWVDSNAIMIYFLADVNGNTATWIPLGGGVVDVQSLTGNSGGQVFPTAGNINVLGDNASGINVVGTPASSLLTIFNSNGLPVVDFDVDATGGTGTDPVVPDANGTITITGGQIATGTIGANVIRTVSLLPNTYTVQIQQTTTSALEDTTLNGVSHFNSTHFTVSNGFVSLIGSGPALTGIEVDANTPPGTDPVVPDGSGNITVTGGQVAAGTVGANVIQTNSLLANTYTIEIQRSAAVAAPDSTQNGVSHFDSISFAVDANGFVTLIGGGFTWNDEAGAFSALANNGYFITGTATATLPASPSQGDTIKFFVDHPTEDLTIQASGTQIIRLGTLVSSAGGTSLSTAQGDSVELVYRDSNECWCAVAGFTGTWILA